MSDAAPLVRTLKAQVDPVPTAGVDATTELGQAPFAGSVTAVRYIPSAAITGAATNNRTVSVTNRGQAGTGTTVVATLTFAAAVNAAAHDDRAVTLSATPANLTVAAGDELSFESTHVGTGIADPGGVVEVDVARS